MKQPEYNATAIKPHKDEGLSGWFTRVAWHVGVVSANALVRAMGIKSRPHYSLRDDDLSLVAEQTGIEVDVLKAINPRLKHPDPAFNLALRYRDHRQPICPDCVLEHGYARAIWSNPMAPVCARHKRRLIDTCPHCLAPLKTDAPNLLTCGVCFGQLKNAQVIAASTIHCELAAFISGDTPAGELLPPGLTEPKRFDALLDHIFGMGLSVGVRRGKRVACQSVAEAIDRVSEVAEVLQDWPNGLHTATERLIELRGRASSGVNTLTGGWFSSVCRQFPEPHFAWFRRAQAQYLIEHHPTLVNRRTRQLMHDVTGESVWVTVTEAAALLNTRASALRTSLELGQIPGRVIEGGTSNSSFLMQRSTVRALQQEKGKWLDNTALRALLGTGKVQTQRVLASKLIRIRENNEQGWLGHLRFHAEDARDLLNRLFSTCRHLPVTPITQLRSLADFEVVKGRTEADVIRIYECVLSGRVKPYAEDPSQIGINRYLFWVPELLESLPKELPEATVSAGEAAFWLGIKGDDLVRMARGGRIRAQRIGSGQGYMTTFAINDLLQFAIDNIALARMANDFETTSTALEKRLQALGCRVESTPRKDGVRTALTVSAQDVFAALLAIPPELFDVIRSRIRLIDFDGQRFTPNAASDLAQDPMGSSPTLTEQ